MKGLPFGPLDNFDEEMPDYRATNYCREKMKEPGDQPWFIACGLVKPHLPFSVPKKWFDLFPLETIQLPPHREDGNAADRSRRSARRTVGIGVARFALVQRRGSSRQGSLDELRS